jgi:hypothetical protein
MCGDFLYLGSENSFCIFFCSMKSSSSVGNSMGFVRATVNISSSGDGILAARGAAVSNTEASGH